MANNTERSRCPHFNDDCQKCNPVANNTGESPKDAMSRQAWHILSQQMTHAINCTEHKTSCVSFTELSHAELMAHIETYVDERLAEVGIYYRQSTGEEWELTAYGQIGRI